MGINWKHRKVIVSIVMCVLLCVTAITAMMYTAFGAGSSNIKNVNAIQVYSNDKAGSADTSEGTDTTGNMDKAGSTDTTGNADTPGVSKLAASDNVLEGYCTFYDYVVAPYKGNVYGWGYKEYPKRSINTSSNYADNGKPKLTVGTIDQNFRANQHNCYVNGLNVNTCIYYNGGIKTTGSFSGIKKDYMNASQGIIYGLDKENYKNVLFNVDEPGLFSDAKKTGKTIYLKAGDPTDRYFTNIAWSPDCKKVYMIELNRDQTDMALVSYDATTGNKLETLYKEHNDKYVHPVTPITFLPWDDSKFILQSEKDGYNHLYLFNTKGEQLKQITSGKWLVLELVGFNESKKSAIILSTECSPIQNNLYMVNIETGKRTLLDNGKGFHASTRGAGGHCEMILSSTGKYLYDNYSEPDVPRKINIVSTGDAKNVNYFTAADPWKGYNVPEYSCGTIKAADGTTDLYYRMVKPIGFDPNKKYPTVVYVYGGPGIRNVEARWHYASRSWETYMAQKGYLLFILDNRGSCDRGRDFEQATFRHLGVEEMKDQLKGVEYLKSLAYVDTTRMGVHGWSFGGFMTTSLMTTYPDVFKVGVAGGPVIDWKWYEVMYGERYMDTPQANPEGYAETSLINKAKNLKGKLQIIIGTVDPTVVPQHAISFLKACIEAGTQPDFFVYPGEGHNMMGHQSVHLHERITQYFEDYLK